MKSRVARGLGLGAVTKLILGVGIFLLKPRQY
jgi:hypothetical protein